MTRPLLVAAAALLLSVEGDPAGAQEPATGSFCGLRPPPIPAFPEDPPAPPGPQAYAPARGMGTTLDLGVGAVAPAGPPRRLGTGPMVETGYETASWIALEAAENGWVRLRLLDPGAAGDGTAWAVACHLSASDPPLVVTRWAEALAAPGPVFFRRTGWSDHDAMLEPLELRGDWMRVRVTRPSTYCVTDPPPDLRVDEGWIRWRDDAMGPWVWTFTRGC